MKKLFIKLFVFFIAALAFAGSIPEKLDILVSVEENPETLFISEMSKSKKTQKEFDAFVKNYSSVLKHENQLTFFYYIENAKRRDKLFVFTDLPESKRGVEMNRAGKTGAFYKTIEIPENLDSVKYSFRKETGFFLSDPNNPLCYCDSRKSSLIRLSENSGAFVLVKDYEKDTYTKLSKRTNLVYLPAAYFAEPEKAFPVIYWMDSQNLWDNEICPYGGWRIDTTMERLVKEGKCRPFIIAGLSSSKERTEDYAGWSKGIAEKNAGTGRDVSDYAVYAEEHVKMVAEDYIPFIEANFRAEKERENRFAAGSSYGSLESAHLLQVYPEMFAGAGLFSGGGDGYYELIEEKAFSKERFKIYLDCGTSGQIEKLFLDGTKQMKAYLLSIGYKEGENLLYKECVGQGHNESAWAMRVPDFLEFISK